MKFVGVCQFGWLLCRYTVSRVILVPLCVLKSVVLVMYWGIKTNKSEFYLS
jgi:hypothetical protein